MYDNNSLYSDTSELENQMDACVAVKLNRIMIDSMVDRCIRVSTGRELIQKNFTAWIISV
jgi:hypothetical protein